MVVDSILIMLSVFYKFLIGLIPDFNFLDSLINAKNQFISFLSDFISYTLYLFNVPVLKLSVNILVLYLTFLVGEYLIKLGIKYLTNLL